MYFAFALACSATLLLAGQVKAFSSVDCFVDANATGTSRTSGSDYDTPVFRNAVFFEVQIPAYSVGADVGSTAAAEAARLDRRRNGSQNHAEAEWMIKSVRAAFEQPGRATIDAFWRTGGLSAECFQDKKGWESIARSVNMRVSGTEGWLPLGNALNHVSPGLYSMALVAVDSEATQNRFRVYESPGNTAKRRSWLSNGYASNGRAALFHTSRAPGRTPEHDLIIAIPEVCLETETSQKIGPHVEEDNDPASPVIAWWLVVLIISSGVLLIACYIVAVTVIVAHLVA